MNLLTFVVTCKGRLSHLIQSLPRIAAQPNTACVLVDYDCPDHCGAWAADHFPQVTIVRQTGTPGFNISHARNLGAKATSADWICFIDADVVIDESFSVRVLPLLAPGNFYRPTPTNPDLWGTHLCRREDFFKIGGYDEVMHGWGGEDNDLYFRLSRLGLQQSLFQAGPIQILRHGDQERTRFYSVSDKWTSQRVNALYINLKSDIARQLGLMELPTEMRRSLYTETWRSVNNDIRQGRKDSHFEVNLPGQVGPVANGWHISRRLLYTMTPTHLPVASASTTPPIEQPTPLPRKLHIGCGKHSLPGWLNTDVSPVAPDIMRMDARQPFPFAAASFDFVFSEHVIEHMHFPEGCAMLSECYRVLRPGGRIRIATPDLAFFVQLYNKEKSVLQQQYIVWSKEKFLPWAPAAEDTYVINNAVRDWGHQFIYDEKVLLLAMGQAGFTQLRRVPLMKSATPELVGLENESRAPPGLVALETMVMEGYRA